VAYFNAGLRVADISDLYHPREVGFYIPNPVALKSLRRTMAIQTNDVDVDYRELAYITDRAGNGLHILEFTGEK
jgi:hypothetical protein